MTRWTQAQILQADIDIYALEHLYIKAINYKYTRTKRNYAEQEALDAINRLKYWSKDDFARGDLSDEEYYRVLLKDELKQLLDEIFGGKGIFSLSATWESPLMWSHYADEHRGYASSTILRRQNIQTSER